MLTTIRHLIKAVLAATVIVSGHSSAQQIVTGSTPAEFAVNAGSASYAIPIQVAPGRGGMQPDLSLQYPGGPNGILGASWSLGGLSAIQRCTANIAQDGFTSGITFGNKDRYCMGGQRLVAVSGINGGVGTEYRTEVDGYSEIKSYGGSTNNPEYWVVKTKAGQTIVYGGGGNATHSLPQGRVSWSIRTVNDTTNNNTITYDYLVDQNTQYLNTITYTGGRVQMNYTSRSDNNITYYLGSAVRVANRLSQIDIYADNNTFIKSYKLDYRYYGQANVSQLISVQECSVSECLNKTQFDWNTNTVSNIFSHNSTTPGGFDNDHQQYFNDYNNDGLTDYAVHHPRLSGGALKVYLANSDGSFSHAWTGGGTTQADTEIYFGDYDGDGKLDYITRHYDVGGGAFYVYLGNGNGTFGGASWIGGGGHDNDHKFYFGDFNGDGRTDYMKHHPREYGGAPRVHLATGGGAFSSSGISATGVYLYDININVHLGDFNADGITDYIHQHDAVNAGQFYVYLGNGDGSFTHSSTSGGGNDNDYNFYFEDVNGDGATDYVLHHPRQNGGQLYTYLSKGDGTFTSAVWSGGGSTSDEAKFYFGDYNGDRSTDYMMHHHASAGGQMRLFLGNGDGSFSGQVWAGPGSTNEDMRFYFGDYNGDGLTDYSSQLHTVNSGNVSSYLNNSLENQFNIVSITDANQNITDIMYKPLTDSSVYTKGSGAAFPVQDLRHAQYVVSQISSSNGIGGTNVISYFYEGLKAQTLGRGSYGYSKITETYETTGKVKESYYNQTGFPFIGYVDREVESYNGQLLNESITQFSSSQPYSGVYAVHIDQSVSSSYELDGNLITTITSQNSNIDTYGNIGTLTVSTVGNNPVTGTSETFVKTTQNTYTNDTTNWHLGRLSETTVTHSAPGQPDQQRRSTFTYDNTTGLLATESVVSAITQQPLTTTTYQYDAYGQKTQVTVSATGETDRITTTAYDSAGRPAQVCNALNECETHTYTPEGWLQTTTGPNSITTTWQYDTLGRKIRETRADGTETIITDHFVSSGQCGNSANYAYSCRITDVTGSEPTTTQYDALGREVRKIATGFDGRLIYSDKEYNTRGLVSRVSRNYFAGDHIYWANSQYDVLERIISMDEPSTHGSRNTINTAYNGLITTVTSGPEQRQKLTYTNAQGEVIRREEEEGSYVEYTYSADGNLKTTTIAANTDTTITLSYDEFGRKVGMDDPDMGVWSYSYNAFGQLISQTDAKNQTTTMAYDVLGRMTSRTDLAGTANTHVSTWIYGDNTAPQGSIGKLLSETANGITKTYYYDNLGRPDETNTTIDPGLPEEQSFTSQTLYDSIGRVSRTIYPGSDNFYTENLYNANGFLESVRGLRSAAEQYDLSQLTPLVTEAVNLAADYQTQANELKSIGEFYETKANDYSALLAAHTQSIASAEQQFVNSINTQGIHFEQGSTAGLQTGIAYDYFSAGGGVYYIHVPDTFVPIHGDIVTPIIVPATHHYQITDSNGQQTITQITAAAYAAVESSLTANGQIYVHDSNTIYSSTFFDTYSAQVTLANNTLDAGLILEEPSSNIVFTQGLVHDLRVGVNYDYYSAGDNQTYYIRVPDVQNTISIAGITIPQTVPTSFHYRVTLTEQAQIAERIPAAIFNAQLPALTLLGHKVFKVANNQISCNCDGLNVVYQTRLQQHAGVLSQRLLAPEAAIRDFYGNSTYAPVEGSTWADRLYSSDVSSAKTVRGHGGLDTLIINSDDAHPNNTAGNNNGHLRVYDFTIDDIRTNAEADRLQIGDFLHNTEELNASNIGNYLHIGSHLQWGYTRGVIHINRDGDFTAADHAALDADIYAGGHGSDLFLEFMGNAADNNFEALFSHPDNSVEQFQALIDIGFLRLDSAPPEITHDTAYFVANQVSYDPVTANQISLANPAPSPWIDPVNPLDIIGTANGDQIEGTTANENIYSGGIPSVGAESIRGNGGMDTLIFDADDSHHANSFGIIRVRDFIVDNTTTNPQADRLSFRDFLQHTGPLTPENVGGYIHIISGLYGWGTQRAVMFINREGDFTDADRAALEANFYDTNAGVELLLEFQGLSGNNNFETLTGYGDNTIGQFQALAEMGFLDLDVIAFPQNNGGHVYTHLNNTIKELQSVIELIDAQTENYAEIAEQIVVLAEQTLAAADNSFQYERTLSYGATAYTELINEDAQYTTYWKALDVDASGRISAEVYGNGIVNDYTYNQGTGQLQHIHSGLLTINPIRHLEYEYDAYQNVTVREDHANDIRETFEYDRLDRLTRTDITSSTYTSAAFNGSQTQTYDVLGNITHKSDVGAYLYGNTYGQNGAGPHAVISAGGNTYQYDANGNMTAGDGRTVQWGSFNKPTLITKGTSSAEFFYGADRARYKKVNHQGDTTLYVGKLYEHKTNGASQATEEKHYIFAMGQMVAEHIVSSQHGVQTRYLHKDALGSIDLITDGHANVVDRRSFDAWGKLRNLTWQNTQGINDPLYLTQLPFTDRGYTGHEHIQEVGLIHMNGRVYDATLARFMSADPHIQEGALTQSYNRYSYVMNNPLKYSDPSGYFFKKLFKATHAALLGGIKLAKKALENKYIRIIATIAAAYFSAGAAVNWFGGYASMTAAVKAGAVGAAAFGGAVGGFVGGFVGSGGDLKAALIGGITGAAAGFIGASSTFGQAGQVTTGRVIAHGVVGGVSSVAQGGKFGTGFISSAFTKIVSNPIQGIAEKLAGAGTIAADIVGTMGAAIVGGTASVLGGGKFANGAQTAAIQYLFNQAVSGNKPSQMTEGQRRALQNQIEQEKEIISELLAIDEAGIVADAATNAGYGGFEGLDDFTAKARLVTFYAQLHAGKLALIPSQAFDVMMEVPNAVQGSIDPRDGKLSILGSISAIAKSQYQKYIESQNTDARIECHTKTGCAFLY